MTARETRDLKYKADLLDRLVDFIIRDYLLTCDEADRDFGKHATIVFQYAQNYVDDTIMHIDGVEIQHDDNPFGLTGG